MKKPIWTKADAKRAEKMGWWLHPYDFRIKRMYCNKQTPFKSDLEAVEWVMEQHNYMSPLDMFVTLDEKICRKAITLACLGA